jgi:hypothetical protein
MPVIFEPWRRPQPGHLADGRLDPRERYRLREANGRCGFAEDDLGRGIFDNRSRRAGLPSHSFAQGRPIAAAAAATPLKRAIEADDVAKAVIGLRHALTHTTGSIVRVDSGNLL